MATSSLPKSAGDLPDELAGAARERGVTPRVVVLSLLLAVSFAYVIPVIDYKFFNTFLGATHLPPGAVGALILLLLVVNPLLRVLSARLALARNEVLTVYLTCLFSTLTVGIGGNNYFVSFIIGSFYYSTRENRWFDALKGLPPWFTPALGADGSYNRVLVENWYQGIGPDQAVPWAAWLVPLCAWGLFFGAAFWMMACLSVMLRAQWGDNEVLAFPLLRLPLEMTRDMDEKSRALPPFFRDALMWSGFAIVVFVQGLNGLNLYFPDVPAFPLGIDTSPLLTEAPWNQVPGLGVRIFPIAVGISYLLTAEIAFSLWAFFLLFKIQYILAYTLGFAPNSLPNVPQSGTKIFVGYQEVGAYLAYAVLIFWSARRHFAHIFRRATGRQRAGATEASEALPYPVAFWGFIAGFAVMVAWSMAAGVSLTLSLFLWISYVVIAVVLSRVVAEGGLLFVHHTWMPLGTLAGLFGQGTATLLSPLAGAAPAAFIEMATIQDFRASLMPSFVQGFKLAHDRGIAARPLLWLIGAVITVGMVVGFAMNVQMGYRGGGGLGLQGWLQLWGPSQAGSSTYNIINTTVNADPTAWLFTGVGIAVIAFTILMRARFAWFPFHPLGYLMATSYPVHAFWFSIFLGWLAKTLIGRYGGSDSARRVLPFFLGLALGDVMMMLFWIGVDGYFGRTGHQLMPG